MLDCGRDGRRASSGGNPRLRITYVNTTVQKLGLLSRCGLRDKSPLLDVLTIQNGNDN